MLHDDTLLRQAVHDAGGDYASVWSKIKQLAAKTVLAAVHSVVAAEELSIDHQGAKSDQGAKSHAGPEFGNPLAR